MKIPIFMIFSFFGILSAWATKALEDGKVTAAEGLELIVNLAGILGVQPEFNISDYLTPPSIPETIIDEEQPTTADVEPLQVIKPEE